MVDWFVVVYVCFLCMYSTYDCTVQVVFTNSVLGLRQDSGVEDIFQTSSEHIKNTYIYKTNVTYLYDLSQNHNEMRTLSLIDLLFQSSFTTGSFLSSLE